MNSDNEQPVTITTKPAPKTITVARRMYLVPKDVTIPGGMTYRLSDALRPSDAEFVADDCGLPPHERLRGLDFYTYEKLETPEPGITIQGGLVLGNVRFADENPDEARPVVMFLDGSNVAVVWPDGSIEYEEITPDDYDLFRNDMIFDVIFDPEHATASEENTK